MLEIEFSERNRMAMKAIAKKELLPFSVIILFFVAFFRYL